MIYLTSDIHGAFDIHKINPDEFIAGQSMTDKDYLIICGDFGCLWDGGSSDRFWLNWLESLPWNTLFIDGNHENFSVIESYPEVDYKNGKARQIRSNIFYLQRGEIYTIEGKDFLCMGGGYSHDVQARQEGVNWWKEEIPDINETERLFANLEAHGNHVDYILSHDVYRNHPLCGTYYSDFSRYGKDQPNLHDTLQKVHDTADYTAWFCGHYHKDCVYHDQKAPCYTFYDNVLPLKEYDNFHNLFSVIEHESGKD